MWHTQDFGNFVFLQKAPKPEAEVKTSHTEMPKPEAGPAETPQPQQDTKTSQSKPGAAKSKRDHNKGRRKTLADLATVVGLRDTGLHEDLWEARRW